MAPAPMTTTLAGILSSTRASLLVTTPSPTFIPGNRRSPEPAAIRMRSPSSVAEAGAGLPSTRRERDRMRAGDGRVGFEVVDFVFLEEIKHALGELVGGGARTRDDFGEIEADFAGLDAVFFRRAADRVHRAGGVEQRLRRDASPVEAYAAGAVALDDGDAHFQLRRANRGDISARSGANYNEVIAGVCQDEVPSEVKLRPYYSLNLSIE